MTTVESLITDNTRTDNHNKLQWEIKPHGTFQTKVVTSFDEIKAKLILGGLKPAVLAQKGLYVRPTTNQSNNNNLSNWYFMPSVIFAPFFTFPIKRHYLISAQSKRKAPYPSNTHKTSPPSIGHSVQLPKNHLSQELQVNYWRRDFSISCFGQKNKIN